MDVKTHRIGRPKLMFLNQCENIQFHHASVNRIVVSDVISTRSARFASSTAFQGITANVDIPQGHKMALTYLAENDQVMKYGFSIGHAVDLIAPGDWVHTHNMETNLS